MDVAAYAIGGEVCAEVLSVFGSNNILMPYAVVGIVSQGLDDERIVYSVIVNSRKSSAMHCLQVCF